MSEQQYNEKAEQSDAKHGIPNVGKDAYDGAGNRLDEEPAEVDNKSSLEQDHEAQQDEEPQEKSSEEPKKAEKAKQVDSETAKPVK